MTFIATSQLSLQAGFQQMLSVASQEKNILNNWATQLAGNITGIDAMNMVANLNNVIGQFNTLAALPGLQAYAQTQFGNGSYDVSGAFTTMLSALNAVLSWLTTNVPSNGVSLVNGVLTGVTYTPAQTSALRSLVQTAATTIS
jgi:hypothetical protein